MSTKQFSFVTNHGLVLSFIARQPRATTREMADAVGITERTAYSIIRDLVDSGYISRKRAGRQNAYRIRPRLVIGEGPEREAAVTEIFKALSKSKLWELVSAAHNQMVSIR
ncbi:MAG: MarR family transcriptional regulator [Dehalococcoidia bacterium]|nr:MarR family transcriptional regulator [Dehalococcoidia bacterium]